MQARPIAPQYEADQILVALRLLAFLVRASTQFR